MNTLYKSQTTLNTEVSVVWPQDDIVASTLTVKMRNDTEKNVTMRKWNGKDYNTVQWCFTGSALKVNIREKGITVDCPIITVSNIGLLPYNTCTVTSSNDVFLDQVDSSNYEKALLYPADPNSPQFLKPKTIDIKGLPPHVAKLVLADSISKNEACPITSDQITMANGLVTSCGHVFTKVAIHTWLSSERSKGECPVCKQKCL